MAKNVRKFIVQLNNVEAYTSLFELNSVQTTNLLHSEFEIIVTPK